MSIIKEIKMIITQEILSFSFIAGVIASFIAWLLVAQIIRPHIELSDKIEKEKTYVENRPYIYRVKVKNKNWCYKVFDVNVYGKVKIRGLNPERPNDIKSFLLKVGNGIIPYINPYHIKSDNIKGLVIKVPNSGKSQKGQLKKLYCQYHKIKTIDYLGLSEVFDIYDKFDIEVEISLICTHIFSGARSIIIKTYRKEDIEERT